MNDEELFTKEQVVTFLINFTTHSEEYIRKWLDEEIKNPSTNIRID